MVFFGKPVGLSMGRDHEPHYDRREGMVLMPYDPLWVGQLAGLRTLEGQDCGTGGRPTGYSLYERQYSFRRQPEVTQRGKGVTTQTCFLPRGRRAQARSVGEGASPCQANLGVFHGRLLGRGVWAKGAGPSGRRPRFSVSLLFVCLFKDDWSNDLNGDLWGPKMMLELIFLDKDCEAGRNTLLVYYPKYPLLCEICAVAICDRGFSEEFTLPPWKTLLQERHWL